MENKSFTIKTFDSSTYAFRELPIWSEFGWMQPILYHDRKEMNSKSNLCLWAYRCEAFRLTWLNFINKTDEIINEFLNKNIDKLLDFVDKISYVQMNEIPTCFSFVGANIGDHHNVFKRIRYQLKVKNSTKYPRKIIILSSHECPTVLHAINRIIDNLEFDETKLDDNELNQIYTEIPSYYHIALSRFDNWYYKYKSNLLIKFGKFNPSPHIIMFVDAELFAPGVLDGIIKFCHFLRNDYMLPNSIIMGISFSSHFIETQCEPDTFRKLFIRELDIFNSRIVGKAILDMIMYDPCALSFCIPISCINLLEYFFFQHSLSVFSLIKHIYYICLDFFNSSSYSFLNRPHHDFFEKITKKNDSESEYDIHYLYKKIYLLLESTSSVLNHKTNGISIYKATVIIERKCALNLVLKFDDCLRKLQEEVGETPKKRDLMNMNERQKSEYIENTQNWLFSRSKSHPSLTIQFLKLIKIFLEKISKDLTEIQKSLIENKTGEFPILNKPTYYIDLKTKLTSILSIFDEHNYNSQFANEVKLWVNSYLQTLLIPVNSSYIIEEYYIWHKYPQWLEDELNPRTSDELLHTLASLLPKLIEKNSKEKLSQNTSLLELSIIKNKNFKCSPLLQDLAFIYQIYEKSENTSNLWNWFTIYCEIKKELLKNPQISHQEVNNISINMLHTRFALAIGTLKSLIGLLSIYSYNSTTLNDIHNQEKENKISGKQIKYKSKLEIEDFINSSFSLKLEEEEKNQILSLKNQLSSYRVKKLNWGKILDDNYFYPDIKFNITNKKKKVKK